MHVLIAFITAVASLLYALERLGVDIGWLNPWAWRRRRRWLQQVHANPAFALESPMEVVALLMTATARVDGEISSEEKVELRRIFENTFKLTEQDASALLLSSKFILGDGEEVYKRPQDVLANSLDKFTDDQTTSALALLQDIAGIGESPTATQREFISSIQSAFAPQAASGADWQ